MNPLPKIPRRAAAASRARTAFTLLEVMVVTVILVLMMMVLFQVMTVITSTWTQSTQRVDAFQGARLAFDRVTRMLSQATLNVYWDYDDPNKPTVYRRQSELQFFVTQTGANGFPGANPGAGTGHGVFFQVPIGATAKTDRPDYRPLSQMLSAAGFSVRWTGDKDIRPPFIKGPEKFRFRLMQYRGLSEKLGIYKDTSIGAPNATPKWIQDLEMAPLADNIVWLAIHPRLSAIEDPEGDDLTGDYTYDSRKDADRIPQPISANQLPPTVQVTMIAIDEKTAMRLPNKGYDALLVEAYQGTLADVKDYQKDLDRISQRLTEARINFRIFSTTVQLRESSWSR